jgi:hypothetical protein
MFWKVGRQRALSAIVPKLIFCSGCDCRTAREVEKDVGCKKLFRVT